MTTSIRPITTLAIVTTEQFKTQILPLKNRLYRYAVSVLKNEADAKDVVQDAMIKAWEQITNLSEIRSIEAWCITVIRNLSINKLKKKGRVYVDISEQQGLLSTVADPYKETAMNDDISHVQQLMQDLPVNQRDVLHHRDIEGLTYKEIAELLDLELSNVKVLLFRARRHIRENLTKAHNHGISHA